MRDFIPDLKTERRLLAAICLAAAIRLFLFSAAFPFFNNVDERAQFDTVHKYARGWLPRAHTDTFDNETAALIALYGSPEYFSPEKCAPPFRAAPDILRAHIQDGARMWTSRHNHEAFSPPLYYLIAGQWLNLGKGIGFQSGDILYWVRFLNIPLYLLTLWGAWHWLRQSQPKNFELRLGALLFLAFLPQDTFYSINNDVLCPAITTAALILLSRLDDNIRFIRYAAAGLVVAAGLLTKLTDAALLPLMLFFAIFHLSSSLPSERPKRLAGLALLGGCALLPFAGWMIWNIHQAGGALGTAAKAQAVGIDSRPMAEWLQAPVFSSCGAWFFISDFIQTFWRGEFYWHGQRLASPWADTLFITTTLAALSAGLLGIWRRRQQAARRENFDNLLTTATLLCFVGMVFVLSLRLRYIAGGFADLHLPPIIANGRFAVGALVPFAILYTQGIQFFCSRFPGKIRPWMIMSFIGLSATVSEIALSLDVFCSPYNWFHLGG
ncbi:MAG: glycosyltransferase family 39 protein [Verrucomicrobiae bacterium]|nr:glycosyltransferase family 39 protein [Verrucomicrobiae bacterium]